MTQPTLDGTPAHVGLWRRVLDGDHVDHAAWLRARAAGEFVGSCRCGDVLAPARPSEVAGRTDYLAACRRGECGWELVAPGGRVRRQRSGGDRTKGARWTG